MFDEFSDDARRVVALAEEAARRFQHTSIGTEHLLIGLLEGPGTTPTVLAACGVPARVIRERMDQVVVRGSGVPPTHLPLSPRATQALELTSEVARDLGQTSVEPPHLLIALLDGQGIAARVLAQLGISAGTVRAVLAGEEVSSPLTLPTVAAPAVAPAAVPVPVEALGPAAPAVRTGAAVGSPPQPPRAASPAPLAAPARPAPSAQPAAVRSEAVAEPVLPPTHPTPETVAPAAEGPVAAVPAAPSSPAATVAAVAAAPPAPGPRVVPVTARAAARPAGEPAPAPMEPFAVANDAPVPGLGEPRCGFCGRRTSRYVTARESCICEDCVELSLETLDRPGNVRARIRPRFAGPPDADAAEDAIAAAFELVFGSDAALEERLTAVEGEADVAPALAAALGRLPDRGRGTAHVDHVRFLGAEEAEVQLVIPLHPGRLVVAGHAVLVDGIWSVAGDTVVRLAVPTAVGQPVG